MQSKFETYATKNQLQAVKSNHQNILVSASAGSGKTAVLVERILYQVIGHYLEDDTSDDPSLLGDLSNLLVVTFTNKAAKQMRERLEKALRERLAQVQEAQLPAAKKQRAKQHLLKQLRTLNLADISTMDSFCSRLLKRYYYALNIDPNFRILADQAESQMLKIDVWEKVREEAYAKLAQNLSQKQPDAFLEVYQTFSNGKNDDSLTDVIFSIDTYANASAKPKEWLANLAKLYQFDKQADITLSPLWQNYIIPEIKDRLAKLQADYEQVLKQLADFLEKAQAYWQNDVYGLHYAGQPKEPKFDGDLSKHLSKFADLQATYDAIAQNLAELQTKLTTGTYEKLQELMTADFKAAPRMTKASARGPYDYPSDLKDQWDEIKNKKDAVKEELTELATSYFAYSQAEIKQVLTTSQMVIGKLTELTSNFRKEFAKEKKRRHLLDYSDMEHLALELLTGNTPEQVRIQAGIKAHYQEVMVDEYQDTNELQEALLTAIAADDNCSYFMVGDVKQSIYRFRQADPSLFINKYHNYQASDDDSELIILPQNYRSAANITGFTNLIFSQIMDAGLGEIDYDQAAQLISANKEYQPELSQVKTELVLYETNESDNESDEETEQVDTDFELDSKEQAQVDLIAHKIKSLVGKQTFYNRDTKQEETLAYKDIAILAATHAQGTLIAEEFKRYDIPVEVTDTNNYFKTTEIQIILSLLRIIDNPHQDIYLVATLRSPLYGFDENELAYLRIVTRGTDFYGTLLGFKHRYENEREKLFRFKADNDFTFEDQLAQKVNQFLSDLTAYRDLSRKSELAPLIWTIYEQTGFLEYVGGMPGGKQRLANLHALYERASQYEELSYKGIFQFLRFIEQMQKNDQDLAELEVRQSDDAVSFMTIHKSKGLEFPVVFVMDLGRRFNLKSFNKNYILDDKLGLGLTLVSEKQNEQADLTETLMFSNPSPVHGLIKKHQTNLALAEEMRKLYVALTRAEQRLYLVGHVKSAIEALDNWQVANESADLLLPTANRVKGKSYLDWIGPSLMRQADIAERISFASDRQVDLKYPAASSVLDDFKDVAFKVEFWNETELKVMVANALLPAEAKPEQSLLSDWVTKQVQAADSDLSSLKAILDFRYPNEALSQTTAYQAVSDIRRLFDDPDNSLMENIEIADVTTTNLAYKQADASRLDSLNVYNSGNFKKPAFMQTEVKVTPAAIGTATHLVFQHLDLTKEITQEVVAQTIDKLVLEKLMTQEVADLINQKGIQQLYTSDLGKKIIANQASLERELPFSLLYPASHLFEAVKSDNNDPILIHGIIDGCFEDENGAVVIFDYKTDVVNDYQTPAKIADRYRGQLNLYSLALESIKQKKVAHRYLYLVSTGQVIEV